MFLEPQMYLKTSEHPCATPGDLFSWHCSQPSGWETASNLRGRIPEEDSGVIAEWWYVANPSKDEQSHYYCFYYCILLLLVSSSRSSTRLGGRHRHRPQWFFPKVAQAWNLETTTLVRSMQRCLKVLLCHAIRRRFPLHRRFLGGWISVRPNKNTIKPIKAPAAWIQVLTILFHGPKLLQIPHEKLRQCDCIRLHVLCKLLCLAQDVLKRFCTAQHVYLNDNWFELIQCFFICIQHYSTIFSVFFNIWNPWRMRLMIGKHHSSPSFGRRATVFWRWSTPCRATSRRTLNVNTWSFSGDNGWPSDVFFFWRSWPQQMMRQKVNRCK